MFLLLDFMREALCDSQICLKDPSLISGFFSDDTQNQPKKKCDWVLWFTGIAYRNGDLKYEDALLEQCFYDRFNIIISTDMNNYYYLSLQTSPRSSREILLLLHQWGLFGEEKKGTSDFLGQVSSHSSKISIWSSKQAFSNLVLPLSFFSFCFL